MEYSFHRAYAVAGFYGGKGGGVAERGKAFEAEEAPGSVAAVREKVRALRPGLPKRLQQCAEYVLQNPERIAVSTVAELAAGAAVQPSAMMRFCQVLGFSGFSDMQRVYREAYASGWPDYATRLDRLRGRDADHGRLLLDFVRAGHKSLNLLAEGLDLAAMDAAVEKLRSAAVVHIVGYRRAFPAAAYLAYVFENMGVSASLHDRVGGMQRSATLRSGDVVIAITFAPYAPETVDLVGKARGRGVPVVAITDSPDSPVIADAADVLLVREVDVGAFRGMAATLTLAAALAVSVGAARENARADKKALDRQHENGT
jgi:DNA-binding MurR/RpiR family transcriptional regulator